MEVDLIFKIAAIGILVAVFNQLLVRSGREECRRAACAELRQRGSVYRACGVAVGILVVLVML